MIPLLAILGLPAQSGQAYLDEVAARLGKVQSMSVTLRTHYLNQNRTVLEEFEVLKGGFVRYEQSGQVMIVTPRVAWLVVPAKKLFQKKPAAPKNSPQNPFVGMPGLFGEKGMAAIGSARAAQWHGHDTIQVAVDARQQLSKVAKLVYYFDRKTKLPLGFHCNPGSYAVEGEYLKLNLNAKLSPRNFEFTPGITWTQIR